MLWLPIPANGAMAVLLSGLAFSTPLRVEQIPSYVCQWIALTTGPVWEPR
jgi:hypothetical protein